MTHAEIIQTLADAMKDVPDVKALFLSGSYGNGLQDAFSDIDFVLVAESGATDEMAEAWRSAVSKTGEIVLWWDRTTVPVLINAITEDWTRTDLIMLKPEQMGAHSQASLKVVFDHDGLYDQLREEAGVFAQNPKRFLYEVEEFIRILGLLPLADGRKEYINGVLGVFHLRNKLVDLMIEETAAPNRGGILHLNRLITDEQKDVLVSMPAAVPNRDAMIAAHLAYAKAYLPRARARAKVLEVTWPERFEEVTWARLRDVLGVARPYD